MTLLADQASGPETPSLDRKQVRWGDRIVESTLVVAALVSVATTLGIGISLFVPAAEFFTLVPFSDFITGTNWSPLFEPPSYGVIPLVTATLLISLIGMVVAAPIGLASAMYLSEYAGPRVRKTFKPILELLAGIPTVVFGFFALEFVTPILQTVFPSTQIFNALSAGLMVGIMIVPTVASLAEDAMHAVPDALRNGGYALGATKRQITLNVVFPAAISGITAALVLGISRAVGETMIVTIAAGNLPNISWNPLEAMQTMTGYIAQAGSGDVPVGTVEYDTIFAVGALLFVMTLAMNLVSIRLVRRLRKAY